jgi:hypothetical protein
MFCPNCGYEVPSDRARFCTQCRFPIASLKEFIATKLAGYETGEAKQHFPLSQLDINVGAALMIASTILSLIMALNFGRGWYFRGLEIFLFVFGSLFILFLLISRFSPRRRGLSQGAILVAIGTLIATIFANRTEGVSFLIGAAIAIPVILLWARIVRYFFYTDARPRKSDLPAGEPFFNAVGISAGSALPQAQIPATAALNTQQARKDEEGVRFSVTEHSTDLLK